MRNHIKYVFPVVAIVLLTPMAGRCQKEPHYSKYVNTFIATAPLKGLKILGYQLPIGWILLLNTRKMKQVTRSYTKRLLPVEAGTWAFLRWPLAQFTAR